MSNQQAVRAVNNLLKRKPAIQYPDVYMDGTRYIGEPDNLDEAIDAVASAFDMDPFDLWDDYMAAEQEEGYKWYLANVECLEVGDEVQQ